MKQDIACPSCGEVISSDLMSADPQRRRFFAVLRDVHANLPDALRERFPSSEALRRTALISTGYCDLSTFVADSENGAHGLAAFLKKRDRYSIFEVRDRVLRVWTARSMSRRALHKKQFQEVARAALDWIHQETGIDPEGSQEAA